MSATGTYPELQPWKCRDCGVTQPPDAPKYGGAWCRTCAQRAAMQSYEATLPPNLIKFPALTPTAETAECFECGCSCSPSDLYNGMCQQCTREHYA